MKRLGTEEAVQAYLERKLRKPIDDAVWGYFCTREDDCLNALKGTSVGSASFEEFESEALEVLRDLLALSGGSPRQKERTGQGTYSLRKNAAYRSRAIGILAAMEARTHPRVREFRHQFLKDRLLELDEVADWIRKHEEPLPPPEAEGAVAPFTLQYPLPNGWTGTARGVSSASPLGQLKQVAERLCKAYPWWSEAEAVRFVLTDIPVPLGIKISAYFRLGFPASSTITLHIPYWVPEEEVLAAYRLARKTPPMNLCPPLRGLQERVVQFLKFVYDRVDKVGGRWRPKEGRSILEGWEHLRKEWNATYPHWKFPTAQSINTYFWRAARIVRGAFSQPRGKSGP